MTTDVGSHKLMAGQVWQAAEPRTVLIPNGLSAMGSACPRRSQPGSHGRTGR
jgi:thiamine pyrophosphate-dependent acetolactate synthase large subunit-like protein